MTCYRVDRPAPTHDGSAFSSGTPALDERLAAAHAACAVRPVIVRSWSDGLDRLLERIGVRPLSGRGRVALTSPLRALGAPRRP